MITGIFLPLLGTSLGAASVFFIKNGLGGTLRRVLTGFASGVMTAASVWSLLIPSMEMSAEYGRLAFVPAALGASAGIAFLLAVDCLVPHLHLGAAKPEGPHSRLAGTTMLVLAVTIHNLPEGMAVGAVFAGFFSENAGITAAGAYALSVGIAIQNFPEGAIVSLPVHAAGKSRLRAFFLGVLSGAVEPVGAFAAVLLAHVLLPVLPWLLAFSAGAMLYVVVEELIPESSGGKQSDFGTLGFSVGFLLMMCLDVALG